MKKRENKNYSFVPSLTDALLKIPKKIAKKFKKIKKHHYSFYSSQNRIGKAEKERK